MTSHRIHEYPRIREKFNTIYEYCVSHASHDLVIISCVFSMTVAFSVEMCSITDILASTLFKIRHIFPLRSEIYMKKNGKSRNFFYHALIITIRTEQGDYTGFQHARAEEGVHGISDFVFDSLASIDSCSGFFSRSFDNALKNSHFARVADVMPAYFRKNFSLSPFRKSMNGIDCSIFHCSIVGGNQELRTNVQ